MSLLQWDSQELKSGKSKSFHRVTIVPFCFGLELEFLWFLSDVFILSSLLSIVILHFLSTYFLARRESNQYSHKRIQISKVHIFGIPFAIEKQQRRDWLHWLLFSISYNKIIDKRRNATQNNECDPTQLFHLFPALLDFGVRLSCHCEWPQFDFPLNRKISI